MSTETNDRSDELHAPLKIPSQRWIRTRIEPRLPQKSPDTHHHSCDRAGIGPTFIDANTIVSAAYNWHIPICKPARTRVEGATSYPRSQRPVQEVKGLV